MDKLALLSTQRCLGGRDGACYDRAEKGLRSTMERTVRYQLDTLTGSKALREVGIVFERVLPGLHNKNLSALVKTAEIKLSSRHAMVRREVYRLQ